MPAAASTRSDYCDSVCASTEANDVGLGRVDLIGALPNSIPEAGENLVSTEADATDKDEFFEGLTVPRFPTESFHPTVPRMMVIKLWRVMKLQGFHCNLCYVLQMLL